MFFLVRSDPMQSLFGIRRLLAFGVCTVFLWLFPAPKENALWSQPAVSSGQADELLAKAREQKKEFAGEAVLTAEQAVSAARSGNRPVQEMEALLLLGDIHSVLRDYAKANRDYRQLQNLANKNNYRRMEAMAWQRLGKIASRTTQYEEATVHLIHAQRISDSLQDAELAAIIGNTLGILRYVLKDHAQALTLCQKAEAALRSSRDPANYAETLEHIGIIYGGRNDWATAYGYFERTLAIRKTLGDKYFLAGTLSNLGLASLRLEKTAEALEFLTSSLKLSQEAQDMDLQAATHHRLGRLQQKLGRQDAALGHFNQALQIHRRLGDKRGTQTDLKNLSTIHSEFLKDYKGALALERESSELQNQIFGEDSAGKIAELQTKYESEKKEKEIEILKRDQAFSQLAMKKDQLLRNTAFAVAALLIAFLAFTIWRYRIARQLGCDLKKALDQVQTMHGMLPICSNCKKIRDDVGYWHQVEEYVSSHSQATFTHGICPSCMNSLYPEYQTADGPESPDSATADPKR